MIEKEQWRRNDSIAREIIGDEKRKEKLIKLGYEIGGKYVPTYWGCAQSSFLATVDILREFGIEILTENEEKSMFPGFVGLAGGTGNVGIGTCGAVNGASFVVSLATNITIEENARDNSNRWLAFFDVKHYIVEKFIARWGTIICREIQIKKFGMAYDSRNPERSKQLFQMAKVKGCRNLYECTIALGAGWAAEAAWDIVHRSPGERE